MKIVGISGKAESGKDTAAGFIAAVYPRARRVAFADALKIQAIKIWVAEGGQGEAHPYRLLVRGDLLGDAQVLTLANNLKIGSPAFRTFLQDYGHLRRETDGADYWIKQAFAHHEKVNGQRPMLITDVRYKNEAEAILKRRGILLRIERPGHQNKLTPEQRAHPSECDLDDFDAFTEVITNNGDPVDFLEWVLRSTRAYMETPQRSY